MKAIILYSVWLGAGFSVVAHAQVASPGKVVFQKMADDILDQFSNSPTPDTEQWFRSHFYRMGVYSPYFDSRISWFPNSLVYTDLYGVSLGSYVQVNHPEWILKDQYGNLMYIPWGCAGGTCPLYAGDITNPSFRAWWIAQAQINLSKGYLGLWIDDVNLEFRVCGSDGIQAPPMDPNTGQLMTWENWANYVATFAEQIRQSFPNNEIIHNNIWFAGPNGMRDSSPAVQREILASSSLNMERGIGSDGGLTGGTDIWSVYALFAYIDRVHALGRPIALQEYLIDQPTQQYALAGYYLISTGNDRVGDYTSTPSNWWKGWDTDLGTPLGPRTYSNGVFQRHFSNGMVLLGEPGLATQTIQLPSTFTTLDGQLVSSVTLTGHQGIVLLGTGNKGGNIDHYVSDLIPTFQVSGFGPVETDMSNGGGYANDGTPLSLNGVKFAKGLGVHVYSEIHYTLSGSCSAFTSTVGVDDEVATGLGSVIFQVWADGVKLYDSGILHSGSVPGSVSVSLAGKQTLSLVVTNGVADVSWDHGDWANAVLSCAH